MTILELLRFAEEINDDIQYEVRDTRTYIVQDNKCHREVKVTQPVNGGYKEDSITFLMEGEEIVSIQVGRSVQFWVADPLMRAFQGIGIGEQDGKSAPSPEASSGC